MKKKAAGRSQINKTDLCNLPEHALKKLRDIFNGCLATGYFPKAFKKAMIILIPKPGKPSNKVENFRPISLLEIPGKIFKRIINSRRMSHLEEQNILNENQYGFRKGKGTTTAIAIAYKTIANALANNEQCNIILRDVSKAFDKGWHDGFRHRLIDAYVPDQLPKLLSSFLDDRKARIKMDNTLGNEIKLESGVPQGSIISPTLYLYTSPLPPPTHHHNYISYADDITQIVTHPSKSKIIMTL